MKTGDHCRSGTGVRGQTLGHDPTPAGYRIFLLNFARPDGDLPRICARNISALRGDTRRAFTEIQRGDCRRRCERRHRCPKLDGLSSPCLSSPKGSTVPVVSPIPPFATTGTVPCFLQMAKHRPPRATESTPMPPCEKLI